MRRRKLDLKKETLARLEPGDLRLVAGAGAVADTTVNCPSGFTVCGLCDIEINQPHLTHARAGC